MLLAVDWPTAGVVDGTLWTMSLRHGEYRSLSRSDVTHGVQAAARALR